MPTDRIRRNASWLELFPLLLSGPFLLFPSRFPLATALTMLLVVAGWLYCWWVYRFPLVSTALNTALLAFAFMTLVGMLVSADSDLTLSKATGLFLGLATWRYLAFYTETERRLWLSTVAFCTVGMSMIAVGMLSADWSFRVDFVQRIFRTLPPQLIRLPEAADVGVQTNQLAGTILFYSSLPLAFLLELRATNPQLRPLLAASISALVLSALLLLTQSRSAWIGAVVGVFFLLWARALLAPSRSILRRVTFAFLMVGVTALVLLLLQAWPMLIAAFNQAPPTSSPIGTLESISFRLEVWRWALEAIKDFPFTGTGLGTFRRVVLRLYPTPFTMDFAHAHNVFMQVALDLGLLGLIAYLSTLMLSLLTAWRVAVLNARMRPLALGLAAGLVAFHAYGLTDVLALGSKTAVAFWMSLGLLTALWNLETRKQNA